MRSGSSRLAGGGGPLELAPEHDRDAGITDIYQHVYTHDGDGDRSVTRTVKVGQAEYHRAHRHWHIRDFYLHELHADANGAIGDRLSASSRKTTFCVAETHLYEPALVHARSTKTYPSSNCSQNAAQGLWVGWGDLYPSSVSGQSIRITNLADGIYWLVSTVDPDDGANDHLALVESSVSNNRAGTRFHLEGTTVTVLATCLGEACTPSS